MGLFRGKQFFYPDKEGRAILKDLLKERIKKSEVKIIKGTIANYGKVRGIVKIVNNKKELKKVTPKNILVAVAVMPYYQQAIKRVGAVITDEGGLLSHASIISREFKKPCIIGTKIATQVLHDGDLVEVDANKGVVKILKRA